MEVAEKLRTVIRAAFNRNLNLLKEELQKSTLDKNAVQISLTFLEKKASELASLDEKLLLQKVEEGDGSLDEEMDTAEKFQREFLAVKMCVSEKLTPAMVAPSPNFEPGGSQAQMRKFKLPKIELRKFNGEIKEWLPFWGQFEKIHLDDRIAPEDKFQYLIQATVQGTRAREIVESYPPTAINYAKAIESLKTRFGRDDLQVEVYVRELLKLVIQNVSFSGNRTPLVSLYDKLESHLRALETLGVTTDKCAAMLFPLVESSLPEDVLRTWQRNSTTNEHRDQPQSRLEKLIKFLQLEVENDERINLALTGFGLKDDKRKANPTKQEQGPKREIPTATGLLTTAYSKHEVRSCVFCNGKHFSVDCFAARKMSLEDKQNILRKRGCCFGCLKSSHTKKTCKSYVRCLLCDKRHETLMCPELPGNKSGHFDPVKKDKATEVSTEPTLTNHSSESSPKVVLQTLMAELVGKSLSRKVRILIDTGSQRSYILRHTAQELGCESVGQESIVHSLFGGMQTAQRRCNRYKLRLRSTDQNYRCNLEAQETICADIPDVPSGPWMTELTMMGIVLTDTNDAGPIEVLLGADVVGKLMTGNLKMLSTGMTAIETRLGWTLMGKIPRDDVETGISATAISMFNVESCSMAQPWDLDRFDITDPTKQKQRHGRDRFEKGKAKRSGLVRDLLSKEGRKCTSFFR